MKNEVQRYIEAVPEDRRPLFDKLQALIRNLYPDAEVLIWYHLLTFRKKPGWVALGYWKNGVSVYTNGPHHLAEFKAQYPHIKTGKGCINLKITDEVPIPALQKVITHAIKHSKQP